MGIGTSESSDNPNSNALMTAPTVPDVSGDIPEDREEKGNTPKYTSPSDPINPHSQKEVYVPSSSETPADYVYDGEDDEPEFSNAWNGIYNQIMGKQSADGIDTVTDATYSSNGLIQAFQSAISQAK